MGELSIAGLVVVGLVVGLAVTIVWKGLRIVKQAEIMVIERLGKYSRTLMPGWNVIIPIIDQPRQILWRYAIEDPRQPGRNIYVSRTTERIDLREIVYDFPKQNVITGDNVTLEINALLYFQLTDPVKAVYEIQNVPDAIEKLTQTTLRNVLGELDLDQTLTSRDTINSKLRAILDEATDKWGVRVNRVELQDINPPPGIRDDMEKQMRAERERRAQVLSAEGFKRAQILEAEGARESAIERAEGHKQARVLMASGEAEAVKIVFNAVGRPEAAVQYLVAMKYIDALTEIGKSPQKTVFLPYESSAVMGSLASLKEMWGANAQPTPPAIPPKS
jgi:regulator of protease activity HflC (stomatin/prohibitin superfamily)